MKEANKKRLLSLTGTRADSNLKGYENCLRIVSRDSKAFERYFRGYETKLSF